MNNHITSKRNPVFKQWVSHRLSDEVQRSVDHLKRLPDVEYLALMPDVHLATDVCIGTVLATNKIVYPDAVGGDIGCGILAVKFDGSAAVIGDAPNAARLLSRLSTSVPVNRHRRETVQPFPEPLLQVKLSNERLERMKSRDGRVQLGSLGRGNHFLEFLSDDEGSLWLMIHSGSRAMGPAIKAHHLNNPSALLTTRKLIGVDVNERSGRDYLHDVQWARQYASANRLAMLSCTASIMELEWGLRPVMESLIHTDHNHVQQEMHFGRLWWVHRKGAQRVEKGAAGIVPGSMATASYLVRGQGNEESLMSCSHGAGRKLSRTEAKRKVSRQAFTKQMQNVWYDHRKADALRDEAPQAYKDVRDVMKAQRALIRASRKLTPLLNFKGG